MNIETGGTKVTIITTNTFAARNGNTVILIFSMDLLEMMDAANKQHHIGGVAKPAIRYRRGHGKNDSPKRQAGKTLIIS